MRAYFLLFLFLIGCNQGTHAQIAETEKEQARLRAVAEDASRALAEAKQTAEGAAWNAQLDRIAQQGKVTRERLWSHIARMDAQLDYADIAATPGSYIGEAWAFSGPVLDIFTGDGRTLARVAVGRSLHAFAVIGRFDTPESIKVGTEVDVIGYLADKFQYKAKNGSQITLPLVAAKAIVPTGILGAPVASARTQARPAKPQRRADPDIDVKLDD